MKYKHIDYRVPTLEEKIFNEVFPVLKPFQLNRDVKEYIVDNKTGNRIQIQEGGINDNKGYYSYTWQAYIEAYRGGIDEQKQNI